MSFNSLYEQTEAGGRAMTLDGLVQVLGKEGAEKLINFWGGIRVSVPGRTELYKARMRERVISAFSNGASPAQVAERFGISLRTAQRLRERFYSGCKY
jgi:hypothetical protein